MTSGKALDRVLRLAASAPADLQSAIVPILVLGAGGEEPWSPPLAALMRAFFERLAIDATTPLDEVRARIDAWWKADPRLAALVEALQALVDDQGDLARRIHERAARIGLGTVSDLRPVGGRERPAGALLGSRAQLEIFVQRAKSK